MTPEFERWLRAHGWRMPKPGDPSFDELLEAEERRYETSGYSMVMWDEEADVTPTVYRGARMDWESMGEFTQDRRRAANHVGFRAQGFYIEEMLVHSDDGTLLGKIITSHMLGRPSDTPHVLAGIEEVRDDLIRRLSRGNT